MMKGKASRAASRSRGAAGRPKRSPTRRWSQAVTRRSNALDLEPDTFKGSAEQVAAALKRSAERSQRRKSSPFRSAMSMLNFFMNRAGVNLSDERRAVLQTAKHRLRALYGRTESGG